MSNEVKPLLVIDLKKRRIRIHKISLKMLNNPDCIQLLIHPDERIIAVRSAHGSDYLAHRINYQKLKNHCYELYSFDLINEIKTVAPKLADNASYKFTGELISAHSLVKFSLDDSQIINTQQDSKEL